MTGAVRAAPQPFLVVTPLGLTQRELLAASLVALKVVVVRQRPIQPWSTAATALYARSHDQPALTRARAFEVRWRELFGDDRAERWDLGNDADHATLCAGKRILRLRFPGVPLTGLGQRDAVPFLLHAFHVPDPGDVEQEGQRLAPYCLTPS